VHAGAKPTWKVAMAGDDHPLPSGRYEHRSLPFALDSSEQIEELLRDLLAGVESGVFTASAGFVQRLEGVLIALRALKEER